MRIISDIIRQRFSSAAAAEPDASPLTPEQEAEFVLAQSDTAASAPAEDPAVTPEKPTERKDTL